MKTNYLKQDCKKILHAINAPRLPFKWGANPYRGCFHSCVYCYARYTHGYLDLDPEKEFDSTIIVKRNAAQVLRKELSKSTWQRELVNLGSVCDPYQPIEKKYQITRAMLREFLHAKSPLTIATKSDLITRDKDLIALISEETYVDVAISIPTINDAFGKEIDPRASSIEKRLNTISVLRNEGITVGALLMPIVPFLSDSFDELAELFKSVAAAGANYVIPGLLYLIGSSKNRFFSFISESYPELISKIHHYYQYKSPPSDYKNKIHNQFKLLRKKYNLNHFQSRNLLIHKYTQQSLDVWFVEKKITKIT